MKKKHSIYLYNNKNSLDKQKKPVYYQNKKKQRIILAVLFEEQHRKNKKENERKQNQTNNFSLFERMNLDHANIIKFSIHKPLF